MGMSVDPGVIESTLTAAERRVRAGQIRDAASAEGIEQGWLLAGIADAETNMSHCWSELTWACMGPNSDDCGGGPVVAGAADGPCSARQGGIGMFQFDAGDFDDTLRREGDRILSIAGNTQAAVDFVVAMVIRSAYVSGVEDREQAIAWMNRIRVDNEEWDAWIRTVTHYYNGCSPSASCFTGRYAHYRDRTRDVFDEMGAEFWETTPTPVSCPDGIDETFRCQGDDRVRCEDGLVDRQTCVFGCADGMCLSVESDSGTETMSNLDSGMETVSNLDAGMETMSNLDAGMEPSSDPDAGDEPPRRDHPAAGCNVVQTSGLRAWGIIPSLFAFGFISRRWLRRSREKDLHGPR
jgi:hypothetical protein